MSIMEINACTLGVDSLFVLGMDDECFLEASNIMLFFSLILDSVSV